MPRPTVEWIQSGRCDWPAQVKHWTVQIIRQRAELAVLQEQFVKVNMLAPEKVDLCTRFAEKSQQLANSYRNLAKELAYYRSRVPTQEPPKT